jgi:TfoX/Sxy family transcriptional regulator of competence genes
MAYDEQLATRIRALLDDSPDITEKKMFGGLAFLVHGNMAIAASGEGGVLVRVDPARSDELVETTDAYVAEMRGRLMPGWLRVDADRLGADPDLAFWVETGTAYARALPPKD